MSAGLALTAACNQLFGIEVAHQADAATDAAATACDPLAYDPLRYFTTDSDPASGIDVSDGRAVCSLVGMMDLVSFDANDPLNLDHELTAIMDPFWTSANAATGTWLNADGCAASLPWAPGEPSSTGPLDCAAMTTGGLQALPCTSAIDGADAINLQCETDRPSPACRAQATQRVYAVVSQLGDYTAATAACGPGGHPVEIDSSDEFAVVQALASSHGAVPYWIGAENASAWSSPTGCPALFSWAPGDPFRGLGPCVISMVDGMHTHSCTATDAYAICETNN